MKYGIISDTHNHNFSQFASVTPAGLNSRLADTLAETLRAAEAVKAMGGTHLFHGGDLFHVRGSIAPSVLNPTQDLYRKITSELGLEVIINAGNHDMEGRESARLSNAVTALESVGCKIVNTATVIAGVLVIPWIANLADLKGELERWAAAAGKTLTADTDVLIHAPIDGVIAGIPDHGLDPGYLQGLGYRRIFAGHYHNHKDFGGGVYSIGALTHQTWSDVGTKAGHLLVSDSEVAYQAAKTPRFVELKPGDLDDPATVLEIVDGNYVRMKLVTSKSAEIEATRQFLYDQGAKGVTIVPEPPKTAVARTGATVAAGASLEVSVAEFVKAAKFENSAAVERRCQEILSKVRSAA